jgi:hypothetical protein
MGEAVRFAVAGTSPSIAGDNTTTGIPARREGCISELAFTLLALPTPMPTSSHMFHPNLTTLDTSINVDDHGMKKKSKNAIEEEAEKNFSSAIRGVTAQDMTPAIAPSVAASSSSAFR